MTAYLLLGTNLEPRKDYLQMAKSLLKTICQIQTTSKIYESEPWGNIANQPFLNQAVKIKTHLSAQDLLKELLAIEQKMGRIRQEKWANRIIDIDILFYEDQIVQSENLVIPHPEFCNRNFAILPMLEINPSLLHPIKQLTVEEIYLESVDPCEVYLIHEI
jgi:2-amino-4-hydroxy-6-hydroxymethyldihydropteridine diphosphokinase